MMGVGGKGRGLSCLITSHWREVFSLSDTVGGGDAKWGGL